MEEKRKDLKSNLQKEIVTEVINALNESHPSFYYLSTVEIAGEVKTYINESGKLSREKLDLVKDLTQRDIQMLLSLHSG